MSPYLTPEQVAERLRSATIRDAVIRIMVGMRALIHDLEWTEEEVFDKLDVLYDQVAAETPKLRPRRRARGKT